VYGDFPFYVRTLNANIFQLQNGYFYEKSQIEVKEVVQKAPSISNKAKKHLKYFIF
jgi:hypothetical protein